MIRVAIGGAPTIRANLNAQEANIPKGHPTMDKQTQDITKDGRRAQVRQRLSATRVSGAKSLGACHG